MCCEKKQHWVTVRYLFWGSLCLVQCIHAGLCGCTVPVQDKGGLFTFLCLVWVAIAMPGSESV